MTTRSTAANSVYVAMAGDAVNPCLRCRFGRQGRSVLLRNFELNGQESASNPCLQQAGATAHTRGTSGVIVILTIIMLSENKTLVCL